MASMQVVLADRRDGKPVRKICVQAHDGRELELSDLTWIDRDGDEPRSRPPPNKSFHAERCDRAARAHRAARCAAPCCSPRC